MKRIIVLLIILWNPAAIHGQNLPACDSLVIDCCTFDSLATGTLTIYASNNSSDIFGYPSFVLFDSNMDTIAIETVTYFGISSGPQPHTLDIIAPLTLPFTGFLNLYTLFQSSLACSFPFFIPDTTTGSVDNPHQAAPLRIYPNPGINHEVVEIDVRSLRAAQFNLQLFSAESKIKQVKMDKPDSGIIELDINDLDAGIYFMQIEAGGEYHSGKFLKL